MRRWIAAVVVLAALPAIGLPLAHGEIISMQLDLDSDPGYNQFSVTLNHWIGGADQDTAIAQGFVNVDLDIDFDPLSGQATVLTAMATGGLWSINNLLFEYDYYISDPPGWHNIEIPATGIQGVVWSNGASVVTGGSFPASDFGVNINGGNYEEWLDGGLEGFSDFEEFPVSVGLTSGTGTITADFVSLVGTTATYQVSGTLPVNVVVPIGLSTLDVSGVGKASGYFTVQVPEPSVIVLVGTVIFAMAFSIYFRRR